MNQTLTTFCWAGAMLAVALAAMLDWLPDSASATLVVILIAGMSASGLTRCGRFGKAER
jgi:hypothetical protein